MHLPFCMIARSVNVTAALMILARPEHKKLHISIGIWIELSSSVLHESLLWPQSLPTKLSHRSHLYSIAENPGLPLSLSLWHSIELADNVVCEISSLILLPYQYFWIVSLAFNVKWRKKNDEVKLLLAETGVVWFCMISFRQYLLKFICHPLEIFFFLHSLHFAFVGLICFLSLLDFGFSSSLTFADWFIWQFVGI